jgi:L-rhamnose mutarotase
MMKHFCLTLDLKDDPALIAAYEHHHQHVPEAILASIRAAGITSMRIFRLGNRLCLWMETEDIFSFEKKKKMDDENHDVQHWEKLMWQYQQALPQAQPGEKWMLMEEIFVWE